MKKSVDGWLHQRSNLGRGGWSARPDAVRRFDSFQVLHMVEQAPHRDNRVVLSDQRDALGSRRVVVDWRWHEEDMAATMRAQDALAEQLRHDGLGELVPARVDGKPVVIFTSASPFMGATRMSSSPADGVVDADCRVHGLDNLYIASSSVFSTGGFANPTLTVVALAIRVADRIKALHGVDPTVPEPATEPAVTRVLPAQA